MTVYMNLERVRRSACVGARFSIVIPSWNNLPYLQLCVRSIRTNSALPHQLIIHVNDGSDGTLEWVRSQVDLDYSYSATNVGVCHALNSCRMLVSTPFLLYMNDDMYACPGWDVALSDAVDAAGDDLFFLSATSIEARAQSRCMIESDFGTDPDTFDEARLLREFAELPHRDWQGATWPPNVVSVRLWDAVGGYSNEFSPGMYSDPDFSMKLWQQGVRLFRGVSASRVYHFGSKSVSRIRKNPGHSTFLKKWAMTSSTLSKYYLRRGDLFDGPLDEPIIPFAVRIRNAIRRRL